MKKSVEEGEGGRAEEDLIEQAAVLVRAGGVIVYPTETVYGLGCDPADARAVARARAIKGRDAARPMLALTDTWDRARPWIAGLTAAHRRLMQHAPPLPVTIVFDASEAAPPGLVSASGTSVSGTSVSGTVGLRRTADPFCRALIAAADRPVLSTSANRAGHPAVSDFADLDAAILDAADFAVDAGHPLGGTPSTVVQIVDGRLVVLREGAVSSAALRAITEP